MNSKLIIAHGTNKIKINGKEVLNEGWLASRDDDGINAKLYNNGELIEFDIHNRDLMDEKAKEIKDQRAIPLVERLKRQLKTHRRRNSLTPRRGRKRRETRRSDKIKKRTPTPYPNGEKKKKKLNKKK
tara:strand:+ start:1602 stop:1985 length:384 start_codon:yes stop_codon:yes gene_type:complete